ncbi:MAG TPA: hypothetical protein VEY50_09395 [Lysobacter sp.]|nr:hypothetical protein [Lysobacter sp.]
MQPQNETPATAQTPEAPGTGAAAQATTPDSRAFLLASVAWLEATRSRHVADEAVYRALARAHRADPHITNETEREHLVEAALRRADEAATFAAATGRRIEALRGPDPVAGALADIEPMATVVITVLRDRITQTARLVLGRAQTVTRMWTREGNSWRSRDPDWGLQEERLGIELAEYMDALDLPTRVADLLPRPSSMSAAAALARVAAEVRHG